MASSRKESYLVLHAQMGDRRALNDLLGLIQSPVYRHILTIVHHEDLAADVLQETFVIIVKKLYWLKEPAAFRAWVYRIATRAAWKAVRKHRPESGMVGEASDEECDGGHSHRSSANPALVRILADEERQILASLMDGITAGCRLVLNLHYFEGMKIREVAEILGISEGTVKSRLGSGLKQLRRLAGNREDWTQT